MIRDAGGTDGCQVSGVRKEQQIFLRAEGLSAPRSAGGPEIPQPGASPREYK
jgi:hypothetical protein